MRKIFVGLLLFLVVLVAAIALAPLLFKDKIKQALDRQLAERVAAKVEYDPANVSLSLFRSFPDLSLSIDELRVIGQDSFARDTLAYLPALRVGLDLMSVVRGEQIKIKSITAGAARSKSAGAEKRPSQLGYFPFRLGRWPPRARIPAS